MLCKELIKTALGFQWRIINFIITVASDDLFNTSHCRTNEFRESRRQSIFTILIINIHRTLSYDLFVLSLFFSSSMIHRYFPIIIFSLSYTDLEKKPEALMWGLLITSWTLWETVGKWMFWLNSFHSVSGKDRSKLNLTHQIIIKRPNPGRRTH